MEIPSLCLRCLTSETLEMLILCSLVSFFSFPGEIASWFSVFSGLKLKKIRFKGQININYFQIESIITVVRAKNSRCKVFETGLGAHRYIYYI